MKRILALVVLTTSFALTSCDDPKIETEEQKYSYSIGYQFAQNLKGQNVKVDSKALALAVSDVLNGKDPKITEQEMQDSMQKMYEKRRDNGSVNWLPSF
jgi:FKBP-type peptidyl-prolyl cis-trans isomerase FklB